MRELICFLFGHKHPSALSLICPRCRQVLPLAERVRQLLRTDAPAKPRDIAEARAKRYPPKPRLYDRAPKRRDSED